MGLVKEGRMGLRPASIVTLRKVVAPTIKKKF